MRWPIALTAVIMLCSANVLYGEEDVHRFPMDLNDLGLTAKQHQAVESAMKSYQHSYRRLHHQKEISQQTLNTLFLAPTFDSKTFEAKNLENSRTAVEIQTRLFEDLHGILTLEQKRRFIRHVREWDVE